MILVYGKFGRCYFNFNLVLQSLSLSCFLITQTYTLVVGTVPTNLAGQKHESVGVLSLSILCKQLRRGIGQI